MKNRKVKAIAIVLTAVMLISVFGAIAPTVSVTEAGDLEEIREAIGESGTDWQAGSTSVSGLSLEEKQQLCGLKGIRESRRDMISSASPVQQGQPSAFDWRNNGGDWTTSIRDQGSCGSCWAFGSQAAMEAHIDLQKGDPIFNQDLAEQQLLSCSPGSCDGWYEDAVLNWLRDEGTVDEACFPYQADDTIPCDNHCPDWESRIWKITDWGWVPSSTSAIKGHLLDAPLVTGMAVYDDFYYYTEGVYEHLWGDLIGYHLVSMVGYNENDDYWICKNSWGTDWGEGGWFRIGYGQCAIENNNAYIVPPIIVPPIIEPTPDLVITNIWTVGNKIHYTIKNKGGIPAPKSYSGLWINEDCRARERVDGLAPGESSNEEFARENYKGGEIRVCADYRDRIEESNEDNNCNTPGPGPTPTPPPPTTVTNAACPTGTTCPTGVTCPTGAGCDEGCPTSTAVTRGGCPTGVQCPTGATCVTGADCITGRRCPTGATCWNDRRCPGAA
jgi:C1A family cysteine protease